MIAGKKFAFVNQKTGDYVASPPMTGKIPFSAANTNDTSGFIPVSIHRPHARSDSFFCLSNLFHGTFNPQASYKTRHRNRSISRHALFPLCVRNFSLRRCKKSEERILWRPHEPCTTFVGSRLVCGNIVSPGDRGNNFR